MQLWPAHFRWLIIITWAVTCLLDMLLRHAIPCDHRDFLFVLLHCKNYLSQDIAMQHLSPDTYYHSEIFGISLSGKNFGVKNENYYRWGQYKAPIMSILIYQNFQLSKNFMKKIIFFLGYYFTLGMRVPYSWKLLRPITFALFAIFWDSWK